MKHKTIRSLIAPIISTLQTRTESMPRVGDKNYIEVGEGIIDGLQMYGYSKQYKIGEIRYETTADGYHIEAVVEGEPKDVQIAFVMCREAWDEVRYRIRLVDAYNKTYVFHRDISIEGRYIFKPMKHELKMFERLGKRFYLKLDAPDYIPPNSATGVYLWPEKNVLVVMPNHSSNPLSGKVPFPALSGSNGSKLKWFMRLPTEEEITKKTEILGVQGQGASMLPLYISADFRWMFTNKDVKSIKYRLFIDGREVEEGNKVQATGKTVQVDLWMLPGMTGYFNFIYGNPADKDSQQYPKPIWNFRYYSRGNTHCNLPMTDGYTNWPIMRDIGGENASAFVVGVIDGKEYAPMDSTGKKDEFNAGRA